MTTLLITLLFACGDKDEDSALEDVAEETTEEASDTATSEEE